MATTVATKSQPIIAARVSTETIKVLVAIIVATNCSHPVATFLKLCFVRSIDKDKDRGCMSLFVRIRTNDLIPTETVAWFPGAVPDLEGWVQKLASTSPYAEHNWRGLDKGLRVSIDMRSPPTGEEETPKPSKEKRRKRRSLCIARIEEGPDHDASFILEEAEKLLKQAVLLHRQAFAKSWTELARCEAKLKRLVEERDNLKFQQKGELVEKLREELKMKKAETLRWRQGIDSLASEKDTLREQLASIECQLQSVKEVSLARGRQIEDLKAKSVAELPKAKSDAATFISSYRVDVEAANTREKEISDVAKVKLSCALDHARRLSRRETLEEVHARGFDLSADIEKEKTLEEEAATLLSNDKDLASGSDSGGDEDEDPEDKALEDAAPKDATAGDVAPE
ncbi:uncharacterized protein [Nicotiana sylvestris]|uniref:uncharacterized protein n=1 Tax=Nicotiana sylvestris TaxID=4096 RepID=UPI00388CCE24